MHGLGLAYLDLDFGGGILTSFLGLNLVLDQKINVVVFFLSLVFFLNLTVISLLTSQIRAVLPGALVIINGLRFGTCLNLREHVKIGLLLLRGHVFPAADYILHGFFRWNFNLSFIVFSL